MKYKTLLLSSFLLILSCQKAQDEFQKITEETTQKVKDKSSEIVNNTIDEKVAEIIQTVNISEEVAFSEVFTGNEMKNLDSVKGKKISLPNGSSAIVFKYQADKSLLLKYLENQPTQNESKSDKTAKKTDGKSIIAQLKWVRSFLPESMQDNSIFKSIEADQTLEFYRLDRLPVKSTFIYNPKDSTFFHFVEVKK